MFTKFLLTGATGFLGNTIAWILHKKGFYCKALVMQGDSYTSRLPPDTEPCYGDLLDVDSLDSFFSGKLDDTCLIHCAGIVSIASKPNPMIYKVNVEGTQNILHLACREPHRKTDPCELHSCNPRKACGDKHVGNRYF